jgi:tetratricopeptide (TPR) repeat protein
MITSDHGEGLGDHGEQEHGFFLYESTVRVPLIIRAPFQFPVKRVDLIVEHVDLVPTILESLAIPIPGSCQGTSFLNLVFDQKRDKPNIAYSETYYPRRHFGWSDLKTYYSQNWKYIQAPTEELYDLSQDRSEIRNLASLKSPEKNILKGRVQEFIKNKSANALSTAQVKPVDKKDMERLASLGYLASVVRTEGRSNLPDPKDKISLVNDLESAKKYFDRQEYDLAIPLIQRIIQNDPGVIYAYHLLGNCYFQKKMYSTALENYRNVLSCRPDFVIVMYDVVECLSRMERYDAAIEETEKFLKACPDDYTLLKKLASLYYAQKRFDQALDLLKTVLQMDETDSEVLRLIVEISISRREFENARICVERALQINPRINNAYFLLGQIESASGNPQKAIDLFKEELAGNPQNSKAAFYLGEGLRLAGDFPAAIRYYRKTIELDPEFNLPYFIIAKYLAMDNVQILEAILLCEQGTSIEPKNQYTLLGYSLLLQIYSQRGDSEKVAFYSYQARKLQALLNHRKADLR